MSDPTSATIPGDVTYARLAPTVQERVPLPFVSAVGVAALFFLSLLLLPLSDGVGFGGDEGMEVQKAELLKRGYRLYRDIWSDQPPLSSYILSALVSVDARSLLWPRLYSCLSGALLIFCLSLLAIRSAGPIAGIASGMALVSVPPFLPLSCAMMQEMPAAAFGLGAVVLGLSDNRLLRRLVFPLVAAAALHIKLTSILFVGPAALGLLMKERERAAGRMSFGVLIPAVLLIVFWAGGAALLGFGTPEQMFGTHLDYASASTSMKTQMREAVPSLRRDILPIGDLALGAAVGMVVAAWRGRSSVAAVCWAMAAGQLTLALFYRPWWRFYILGAAVPLCFFYAIGIGQLYQIGFVSGKSQTGLRWSGVIRRVVCAALVTQALFPPLYRWSNMYYDLKQLGRLQSDRTVVALSGLKERHTFILTEDGLRAHMAGLVSPPELAVVSVKRWWSGQIDFDKMIEVVERRKIRAALLMNDNVALLEPRLLPLGFREVYHDSNYAIYERE